MGSAPSQGRRRLSSWSVKFEILINQRLARRRWAAMRWAALFFGLVLVCIARDATEDERVAYELLFDCGADASPLRGLAPVRTFPAAAPTPMFACQRLCARDARCEALSVVGVNTSRASCTFWSRDGGDGGRSGGDGGATVCGRAHRGGCAPGPRHRP